MVWTEEAEFAGTVGSRSLRVSWAPDFRRREQVHCRDENLEEHDDCRQVFAHARGPRHGACQRPEHKPMITRIRGKLLHAGLTSVVVDVGGVGYEILISLATHSRLPREGSEVEVLTHLHHKDDTMLLFGFMAEEEREMFRMLIGISGIGPKGAMRILSGIPVEDFKAAVARGDEKMLKTVSGIGPKTASRLIVELKEQIGLAPAYEGLSRELEPTEGEKRLHDAVLALIKLGYTQAASRKALKRVLEETEGEMSLEELVKKSLKYV
jgi:Holliday junction DNA helicase RuvA